MKWIFFWYIALSALTFILYGIDKSAAIKQQWRIQERTLHLCALFGGWPGALLGQIVFRHKTRKTSFLILFWLTVVMNFMAIVFFFIYPLIQQIFHLN